MPGLVDLKDQPFLFGKRDHFIGFCRSGGHGFFHEDVLPGVERSDRLGIMETVGSCDDNSIQIHGKEFFLGFADHRHGIQFLFFRQFFCFAFDGVKHRHNLCFFTKRQHFRNMIAFCDHSASDQTDFHNSHTMIPSVVCYFFASGICIKQYF